MRQWALAALRPACLLLPMLMLLGGCAAQKTGRTMDEAVSDYIVGDYARARRLLQPLAAKTDENFVLNNCRLGSAALAEYNLPDAEAAFLRAYEVINSVGVNDGGRSLGAALVDEKIKVWKGEPFERAMANFYLGLIYYMRRDYGNARAAFENALFKLRDYGEGSDKDDQYRRVESNFALAYVMLAKAQQRLGRPDDAAKSFQRAVELKGYLRGLADPEINDKSNMLLVVDFGYGPTKARNYDGAFVGFVPTPQEAGPVPPPVVFVDGKRVDLEHTGRPPVDMLALGQDRRWQDIDTLRAVKSVLGTGLIGAGAVEGIGRRRSDPALALGLIGAGLLLKATSQADVRQWEMVPRTTFVLPLRVAPGPHTVTVDFPNSYGLRQEWRGLTAADGVESTYYFRMQRYNNGPFSWPPPAMVQDAPPQDAPPPDAPSQSAPPAHVLPEPKPDTAPAAPATSEPQ